MVEDVIDKCVVENKHYAYNFRQPEDNYLDLIWEGQEENNFITLLVNRKFYETVNVGDSIECEIWYNNDGIVKCKILEENNESSG